MRRRWFAMALVVAVAACTLGGCREKPAVAEENFSMVDNMRTQVKNEGIFYIDGYTELMKFYDFHLAQSIPVCDRPNCTHDSADCNAYLPQGYRSGMGCYRDKLYYYDNADPELPFYQCDKNGSGRKLLAKLNPEKKYQHLSVVLPMFFTGEDVIFRLDILKLLTEPVVQEDGTVMDQENLWMLGKVNLTNGKFEILKEEEKLEDGWLTVHDCIDGKVLYAKAGGSQGTEEHSYDLEEKKDDLCFAAGENYYLGTVRSMGKAVYLREDGKQYAAYLLDPQTGEKELAFQKEAEEGMQISFQMAGEKLIYCIFEEGKGSDEAKAFGAYDFAKKQEAELTREEFWYAPTTAETKDWYVGRTEAGAVCISKEDYEKKNWDNAQVIGSY